MVSVRTISAIAALATALACAGGSAPEGLTEREQALVDEVVELYTLRILRFANPDSAAALRGSMVLDVQEPELQLRLEELGHEPKRGELVLRAVHDSLEALRPRLFPAEPE